MSSAWQGKTNIMTMGWHMMMQFTPALFGCYIWSGDHSFQMIRKSRECVIFHRPGIMAKTRELTACAALASRGTVTTETPLRVHINAALTAGARPTEVMETLR